MAFAGPGEEAQEEGYRDDAGQRVGDGHRNEDGVRAVAHGRLEEDDADEAVGDERQRDEDGRDVSVDGHREVVRLEQVRPDAVVVVGLVVGDRAADGGQLEVEGRRRRVGRRSIADDQRFRRRHRRAGRDDVR